MWISVAATLCAIPLQGDVAAAGGDYVDVTFEVTAGTQEIRIAHGDGSATATSDQIETLARQQRLDFVNLSDHNTVAQHALAAAYLQTHPDLLLLRGDEITTYAGHGNAVGLRAYVDHRIGYRGRTING